MNLTYSRCLKLGVVIGRNISQTAGGHKVFLSGGSPGRRGVGICISRNLLNKIDDVLFFCYSDRVRALHFTLGTIRLQVFSCYMPTTWEPDLAVEQVLELLGLLLTCCADSGNVSILGGDFNAVLGSPLAGDDVELLGTWGIGDRSDRGRMFARWILENGLLAQSRMRGMDHPRDSWTCRRSMDGTLIQMDFILTSPISIPLQHHVIFHFLSGWTIDPYIAH